MSIVARNGFAGAVGSLVLVPATQSLVVGNPGGGLAKISTAAAGVNALPPIFSINTVVQPGTGVYLTFASATYVLIEAPASNDIEYAIGAAPILVVYPLYAQTALTAKAGGGQSGATLLGNINRIATVASAADSCILPSAIVGAVVDASNQGTTNSMNVYPQTGEAINSGAANAAFAVATLKSVHFTCAVAGTWNALLGA